MQEHPKAEAFLLSPRTALRGALIVVATFCFCRAVGYSMLYRPEMSRREHSN